MDYKTENARRRRILEQKKRERRMVIFFTAIASVTMILLLVVAFFLGRMSKSTEAMNINTNDKEVLSEIDMGNYDNYSKQIDEIKPRLIADDNNILILVNSTNRVPENWEVDLVELINDQAIDRRAYDNLQKMMDDCRAEGLQPLICSSYRSHEKQEALFQNKVTLLLAEGYTQEEAEMEVEKWIAVPGTSEHELGLALDIVDESNQILEEEQEDTEVQMWLMANAYKYGFILRYPKEKETVTNKSYEPWHYRYVGIEAAQYIYEHGMCLEEYLSSR